jgi:hypothetical protein
MGMPIIGNATGSGVHTPASATFSYVHTINGGTNRILWAFAYAQNISSRGTISGVTFNGVAMNPHISLDVGAETLLNLYYLKEASLPAAGAYTLAMTSASSPAAIQDLLLGSICLSNVYQPASTSAGGSATGTSSTPSITIGSNYSDIVIAAYAIDGSNVNITLPGEQTALFNPSTSAVCRMAGSREIGAAGSTTASGTLAGSAAWGVIAVSTRGTPGRNFQIIN